jgi:hypothetical protein
MTAGGNVVDFHSCDFFPERWFDLVVILRTGLWQAPPAPDAEWRYACPSRFLRPCHIPFRDTCRDLAYGVALCR